MLQVKAFAHVPVIANGDLVDAVSLSEMVERTNVDGVMCARALLTNPALFSGHDVVPLKCVVEYLELGLQYGGVFAIHHHHLMYMLDRHLCRSERVLFNSLLSMAGVIDFFRRRHWWPPTSLECRQ